jgi:hypothetical protein
MESRPLQHRLKPSQARRILDSLNSYKASLLPERQHFLSHYRPIDVAFRVHGTGNVGLRDYLVYLEGNGSNDPLFLQVKGEPGSAYAPYLGEHGAPQHHGQRVAEGQREMQVQTDPFLGWTTMNNRHYLVRQFCDHKAPVSLGDFEGLALTQYAEICGELLALGHCRSGDAACLAGYIGNSAKFDLAVAKFAQEYADQTERDYEMFLHSRFAPRRRRSASPGKKLAIRRGKQRSIKARRQRKPHSLT